MAPAQPLVAGVRGAQCKNNLKQIGWALHNYHDACGCFSPAVTYGPDGRAWHSWRVLVVPYLGLTDPPSGYRFDQPWDSDANLAFAAEHSAGPFRCPRDTGAGGDETTYLAVVGEGTMWPPGGRCLAFREVKDGMSDTLMLVESYGSGVLWTEPRDLRFEEMTFGVNAAKGTGLRGLEPGLGNYLYGEDGTPWAEVLFADGSVRAIDADASPQFVRSLLLRDDGGPKPEDWP